MFFTNFFVLMSALIAVLLMYHVLQIVYVSTANLLVNFPNDGLHGVYVGTLGRVFTPTFLDHVGQVFVTTFLVVTAVHRRSEVRPLAILYLPVDLCNTSHGCKVYTNLK